MKHLYFIRHGQSQGNINSLWSGHTDHPLTQYGHNQAKLAGLDIKTKGLAFDCIISSPLQRAHHTAKHVATAVDFSHDQIVLHEGFKERYFGQLEGKSSIAHVNKYRQDESFIDDVTDIEKLIDMQTRAEQMLEYLHSLPYETILVVAHGSFGRALRRAIQKGPLTERGESFENAKLVKLI